MADTPGVIGYNLFQGCYMRGFNFFSVVFFLLLGCGNAESDFTVTITQETTLDSLPSGSGLVMHRGKLLIIGDDAPFIYKLSLPDNAYESVPLKGYDAVDYRIPKTIKHDFEAVAQSNVFGAANLLAFGSGTQMPARDSLLIVNVDSLADQRTLSLTSFYRHLQMQTHIAASDWNVEGAVIVDDRLYLLNRGTNTIIGLSMVDFRLFSDQNVLPKISAHAIQLPAFEGQVPRFSGADNLNDEGDILFCASVEDTPNWHTDGPVLGSIIGILNVRSMKLKHVAALKKQGVVIKEKIESVALSRHTQNGAEIFACADDDKGHTRLFRINLEWQR